MSDEDQFPEATTRLRQRAFAFGVIPALIGGVVGWLILGAIGAAVLFLLIGVAWFVWARSMLGSAVDKLVEATNPHGFLEGGSSVSALTNAVDGVRVMTGVEMPEIRLISSDAANALCAAGPDRSVIVVTTALLKSSGPTELESIAAELVCRVRDGSAEYLTTASAIPAWLQSVAGASPASAAKTLGEQRSARADLEAVALTRYPPALIAALTQMAETGTIVADAQPLTAPHWIAEGVVAGVAANADLVETAVQPIDYRVAVLREL